MKEINTLNEWSTVKAQTHERPVFVLKHSTACPISAGAYRRVESYANGRTDALPEVVVVKVIESREVSTAIAEDLHVPHRSPQIILVAEGSAQWTASHHGITRERLKEATAEHLDVAS